MSVKYLYDMPMSALPLRLPSNGLSFSIQDQDGSHRRPTPGPSFPRHRCRCLSQVISTSADADLPFIQGSVDCLVRIHSLPPAILEALSRGARKSYPELHVPPKMFKISSEIESKDETV